MKYFSFAIFFIAACAGQSKTAQSLDTTKEKETIQEVSSLIVDNDSLEIATLGGGCFWCVEAVYQRLEGVVAVSSGYTGGHVKNPTYRAVCEGTTGHAEVAQIQFDPKVISYEDILYVFWRVHDPTTLNRQGNDVGTQYRSAIFYHDDTQKQIAEKSLTVTNKSGLWNDPIVTEISALKKYYKAEDYHQNYYNDNRSQSYCVYVVDPKVKKFEKEFKDRLKKQ